MNGYERMRLTGNERITPENNEVIQVKTVTATLIDNLQACADLGGDAGRCARIAQDQFEQASMWATKALTAGLATAETTPEDPNAS